MQILIIIIVTLIPIALWGLYFHQKNPRKKSLSELLKIFAVGMFSVVPVIIFHRYLLESSGDFLVKILRIPSLPVLASLMKLLLIVAFVLFFMAVFTLIKFVICHYIYKIPKWELQWKNFVAVYQKMYHIVPLFVFFVIMLAVEVIFGLEYKTSIIFSMAGVVIVYAIIEEYFKYLISPFLVLKKPETIGSAVVDTLYIGLAFAFIENVIFFISQFGTESFMEVFIFRSIFTTLLHVGVSGILGYFYGHSLFAVAIITNYEVEKGRYSRFSFLKKLGIGRKSIFQSVNITHGFFIAACLHGFFNYLIYLNLRLPAAILSIILSGVIVYILNLESAQIRHGLVGTSELTVEDYRNLRLKISTLKHLADIRSQKKGD